jgi:hypothetical protein
MHFIALQLISHMSEEHFRLSGTPAAEPREYRETISLNRTFQHLATEVSANLLELLFLGPCSDGAEFVLGHDVFKTCLRNDVVAGGKHVPVQAISARDSFKFGLRVWLAGTNRHAREKSSKQ